ncbi:hypothetical protein GCM10017673_38370 [Streptosporangium violaceochromogenes]|nr:hypothetical protein GCM10017673_38370 [Streptosporangium violaceochromogenes]
MPPAMLCADRTLVPDPDVFFPISTIDPRVVAQTEQAKQLCATCPARPACLQTALTGGRYTSYGVWGGEDEDQRRRLLRRRARSTA